MAAWPGNLATSGSEQVVGCKTLEVGEPATGGLGKGLVRGVSYESSGRLKSVVVDREEGVCTVDLQAWMEVGCNDISYNYTEATKFGVNVVKSRRSKKQQDYLINNPNSKIYKNSAKKFIFSSFFLTLNFSLTYFYPQTSIFHI